MKSIIRSTLLFTLGLTLLSSCQEVNPVLEVEGGQIQGIETATKGIIAYKGIPFAAPPTGENRWKEPQAVIPWEGVKVCDTFSAPCYQAKHSGGGYTPEFFFDGDPEFSEDCLYRNIWTPAAGKTNAKLPVTMWIHGGAYTGGWGFEPEMDGEEWAKHDAIIVTINYRLGIYGFFTHPLLSKESPHGVSGNYGLMDQIAALKWVKKNIQAFGGDPDKITIMGQSAGARSVEYLIASPLAKDMISGAIIQSGAVYTKTAASSIPAMAAAEQAGQTVMDWAGCQTLEQMRALSSDELMTLSARYQKATRERAGISTSPVKDSYVMADDFAAAAFNAQIADVPYMIGCTLDDMGDRSIGIDQFCMARETAGKEAYAYQFQRRLPTDGRKDVLEGAFHSSELWFMFKSLRFCWRPFTKGDYDLAERMITYWTNFSRYGNPNGKKEGEWKPLTRIQRDFMLLRLDGQEMEDSGMGQPNQAE